MFIENIKKTEDLKKFSMPELKELAKELRTMIIERVATNGGHLASNLGVVDLTIALHSVFDSPKDMIIWDVGHQSYAHKILTGRAQEFSTIRQYGGISGFPKIDESPHDSFGTGHSSTSISAALGIIEARDQKKENYNVIAVIGDGALTAGLAFEGLNYAGHLQKNMIVILNDNEMSISPNVGALSAYLNRIMTGDFYTKLKKETKLFLERLPKVGEPVLKIAQKAEDTFKGFFVPGMLFEELGFEYVGPIDGHNLGILIETLERFKDFPGPVLIHAITKKGKGYTPAEKSPWIFHGVGPFDIETGSIIPSSNPTYSEIFGSYLVKLAREDSRIIAITAAMTEGTGLTEFAQTFPTRFYDVGIAEAHAVTFAAGMATKGLKPVVAIYSTFLQRAYDEIVHDVCIQNLPVVFAIDRSGIVGEDGPTHNGAFDISYLRHIPNMTILAPKDEQEFGDMLNSAIHYNTPVAIRYPRGAVTKLPESDKFKFIKMGESEILKDGKDILLVAIGNTVQPVLQASQILEEAGIQPCVINARFAKPLDVAVIGNLAREIKYVMTIEENSIIGGFGSAVLEQLSEMDIKGLRIKCLGLPDQFIQHGPQKLLRQMVGLNAERIAEKALLLIGKRERVSSTL
jgi:1-deoxy-D-xylulose-5-phosphate synthase